MSSPPPAAVVFPAPLRVVFFGPPRSGKSKLLDAVAAFARTEADDPVLLLPADAPVAPDGVIRRRVRVDLPGPRVETGDVEFVDCDGRAAQELLEDSDQLRRAKERSELAWYVRKTDALVVVADATWSAAEVDESFDHFRTFLKALREGRTADREVGGLPVFLTLCKCDELARPGEAFTDWQNRVRAETEKLEARFHDWFDEPGGPFLAFGSTDLAVTATATGWPQVVGGVPDTTGGFGVADLHHDLIAAARDHRDREIASRRRLSWTATIAVGLLSLILIGVLVFAAARRATAADALAARVRHMQETAGAVEERLSEACFDRNRRELAGVLENPLFGTLPPDLQGYVTDDLRQFDAYDEYRRRFAPPQFAPADVRTAGERAEVEAALNGTLAPPPEFAAAWEKTKAVRLREKWREDLAALDAAVEKVHGWYTLQLGRLNELQQADVPSDRWSPAGWRAAVGEAVARRPDTEYPPDRPVPGSETLPIARGEPITYAAAYRFERAAAAAAEWERAAVRLTDLRDLADAVGLTANPEVKDAAVLQLPSPADPKESLGLAVGVFARLKQLYPRAAEGKAAWAVSSIPGPLQDTLGRRLKAAAASGVDQVRRLVAADPAVAAGEWEKLAQPNGLLSKPEMAGWGELLRLLVRWSDPDRPDEDPVKHLAAFVAKTEFAWQVSRITVRVPSTLVVNALKRAGDLTVRVGSGDKARTYTFTPGGSQAEPNATTFEFTPAGDGPLKYTRGEKFTAAVTLTDTKGGAVPLEWGDAEARTSAFRFEALLREPRQAAGVRTTVTVRSGSDEFRVPLLLPEVK